MNTNSTIEQTISDRGRTIPARSTAGPAVRLMQVPQGSPPEIPPTSLDQIAGGKGPVVDPMG